MKAHEILSAAAGHMTERASTYDKPQGERSMGATVQAFKAVTGIGMTEEQGWLFMTLLKAVRSQQGAFRADSYEDGAAYFALAGEAAHGSRSARAEPAAAIDDESPRAQLIGQGGEMAEEVYAAIEKAKRWEGAPEWATHLLQYSDPGRMAEFAIRLDGGGFYDGCDPNADSRFIMRSERDYDCWHVIEARA